MHDLTRHKDSQHKSLAKANRHNLSIFGRVHKPPLLPETQNKVNSLAVFTPMNPFSVKTPKRTLQQKPLFMLQCGS